MKSELYAVQQAAAEKDQDKILTSLAAAERNAKTSDDLFVAAMYALQGATGGRVQLAAIEAALRSKSPYAASKAPEFYAALAKLYAAFGRNEDARQAEANARLALENKGAAQVQLAAHQQGLVDRARAERERKERSRDGIFAAASGAIMGAATGYADSGGDTAGAIAGAMSGAAVGASGGNDAQYAYMEQRRAEVTADAEASERQLQRTIARAQSGNAKVSGSDPMPSPSAQVSPSSGQTAASTSTASPARQLPYSTLRVVLSADIAQQQGWRDANHQCTAGTEIPIPSDWPDSIAGANAWIEGNLIGRFASACRTAGYSLTGEPQFDVRNGDMTDFVPRSGSPFHHVSL